jgi:N6-L-threonylcarbamoyladenine synthase
MMKKGEIFLGIETSCDETAAAVVAAEGRVLSNAIASQVDDHRVHGGVVPEVAARAHLALIDGVITRAMDDAGIDFADLSAVAATGGPGLIGGVLVGTVTAKAIAAARGLPYYAINHLEGHALTARLTSRDDGGIEFPYLLLLVSGGHTQILLVRGPGDYARYGTTYDDAAGEAFDKSAKILGLDLPGGPQIENLAKDGDDGRFDLPRPLGRKPGCDFSFSGLKTAVRTVYEKEISTIGDEAKRARARKDMAASLQRAIAESLSSRARHAMRRFKSECPDLNRRPVLVVAGGVGANGVIRSMLADEAKSEGFDFSVPPAELCTDNAVMIAWAAVERRGAGLAADDLDFAPRPRWPLDPDAAPLKGKRRKKEA